MTLISKVKKNNIEFLVIGNLVVNPANINAVEVNAVEDRKIGKGETEEVPCIRLSLNNGQYFIWEHADPNSDEIIKYFTK